VTPERDTSIYAPLHGKTAWKPRPLLRFNSGFTLIEILIVVVILGITMVVATANLFPSDEERLQQEGEKLVSLLQLARDESAFGGRVIAVTVNGDEIAFLERDFAEANRWHASTIEQLSTRKLPDAFNAQLSVGAGDTDAKDAHITFLPIGVAAPFDLTLRSPVGSRKISGDALGNLRLEKT